MFKDKIRNFTMNNNISSSTPYLPIDEKFLENLAKQPGKYVLEIIDEKLRARNIKQGENPQTPAALKEILKRISPPASQANTPDPAQHIRKKVQESLQGVISRAELVAQKAIGCLDKEFIYDTFLWNVLQGNISKMPIISIHLKKGSTHIAQFQKMDKNGITCLALYSTGSEERTFAESDIDKIIVLQQMKAQIHEIDKALACKIALNEIVTYVQAPVGKKDSNEKFYYFPFETCLKYIKSDLTNAASLTQMVRGNLTFEDAICQAIANNTPISSRMGELLEALHAKGLLNQLKPENQQKLLQGLLNTESYRTQHEHADICNSATVQLLLQELPLPENYSKEQGVRLEACIFRDILQVLKMNDEVTFDEDQQMQEKNQELQKIIQKRLGKLYEQIEKVKNNQLLCRSLLLALGESGLNPDEKKILFGKFFAAICGREAPRLATMCQYANIPGMTSLLSEIESFLTWPGDPNTKQIRSHLAVILLTKLYGEIGQGVTPETEANKKVFDGMYELISGLIDRHGRTITLGVEKLNRSILDLLSQVNQFPAQFKDRIEELHRQFAKFSKQLLEYKQYTKESFDTFAEKSEEMQNVYLKIVADIKRAQAAPQGPAVQKAAIADIQDLTPKQQETMEEKLKKEFEGIGYTLNTEALKQNQLYAENYKAFLFLMAELQQSNPTPSLQDAENQLRNNPELARGIIKHLFKMLYPETDLSSPANQAKMGNKLKQKLGSNALEGMVTQHISLKKIEKKEEAEQYAVSDDLVARQRLSNYFTRISNIIDVMVDAFKPKNIAK
jgi:sulfur transfer complex TusBCD TusB component (DsrH family)